MRFGTDGVRGVANQQLTVQFAQHLGFVAATQFDCDTLLIGSDSRLSGSMLVAAFSSGVCATGTNVEYLGVVSTPCVAFGAQHQNVGAAMISASHNAFGDNGIKLFAPGGSKLSDAQQDAIEKSLEQETFTAPKSAVGANVGRILTSHTHSGGGGLGSGHDSGDIATLYCQHVVGALEGRDLRGLHIVIDTANGASSELAPRIFDSLGATVEVVAATPNGVNINDGVGSNHPETLQAAMRSCDADLGFAFDGDADRCQGVTGTGELVDGDQLIAMSAIDFADREKLANNTVVITVMTNLGFRHAMNEHNIEIVETKVGDRYVLEALDRLECALGGEQSGHVIFRELATTGDGVLTAVIIADIVKRSGLSIAELAEQSMQRLPQVLQNVRIGSPMPDVVERIASEIERETNVLGDSGRIVVRPSGTEPLVRVMVEAPTAQDAGDVASRLCAAVEALA